MEAKGELRDTGMIGEMHKERSERASMTGWDVGDVYRPADNRVRNSCRLEVGLCVIVVAPKSENCPAAARATRVHIVQVW